MGFSLGLQKAIFDKLSGVISAPVKDCPRKNQAYPYVVVGEDNSVGNDTDTTVGREVISSIHIWDNYDGYARIKGIVDEIDTILNRASFVIAGYHVIDCVFDSSDFFLESDGKTRHGVIGFRLLIDKV